MIDAELHAKIRRLFFVEHWRIGTIAAELGVHPDAIRRAIGSELFNANRGPVSRATLTEPYLPLIEQTLNQYPRLRGTRIFEMIRSRGYTGSVVQLRRVLRTLRPTRKEAFLRLSTLPGEEGQADWAHFGQVQVGTAKRKLSCFVMTLSYSRALWVEFFFDQRLESLLLGHVHAFQDWAGLPRSIKYDNMASVVSERHGDAIRFHPRLLELCAHYHFAALPCRPARGNEKGRVERAIQYIRHSFFAARRFSSIDDLNRQALIWRDEIAHLRAWPQDDSRRVLDALKEEQPRLLPLPAHPLETDLLAPVKSDKTIYTRFDLNDYSIPPEAVGKQLTLAASPEIVRILDGDREIARHRRSYDRHARIDDPAHIAALVEEKRKALGATTGSRLQAVLPRAPEFLDAAFKRGESISRLSKKLIELLDDYGAGEVSDAIDEALARETPRAASLSLILEQRRRLRKRKLPSVDLSHHPHLQHLAELSVSTQSLEAYDDLTPDDGE